MIRYQDRTQQSVFYETDVRRRILNVDSRFREDVRMDPALRLAQPRSDRVNTPTNFVYRLPTPIRNIGSMRITNVEFPNTAYVISAATKNSNFVLTVGGTDYTVTIPDGNYTAQTLVTAIDTAMTGLIPGATFTVTLDEATYKILIRIDSPFTATFKSEALGIGWPKRPYDFGLGYNMGFRSATMTSMTELDGTGTPTGFYGITSEALVNAIGENYYLLQINGESCVEHATTDNGVVQATAKLILNIATGTVVYDGTVNVLTNAVYFQNPTDIGVLRVRVVDAYGELVDLNDTNFSFSLELVEFKNAYLGEAQRRHLLWNPANV